MIVSADGHAGAPGNLYRDYLDPEFRDLFDDFVGQAREMQKVMFAERDNDARRARSGGSSGTRRRETAVSGSRTTPTGATQRWTRTA